MSHWLVIYDICDDRRLYRVAKVMESYGIRVQRSVFEMEATQKTIDSLRSKIKKLIDDNDYVVYFEICEIDWQKQEKYGQGKNIDSEDKSYYVL